MHEEEIIALIRKRDSKGAELLLQHYGPLMRYIIAPILSNPQDEEECLQEVAMRVWEKIELFDAKRGSFTTWLTAITRNTALNRSRQNTPMSLVQEIPEDMPSSEPTPEEAILQKEKKQDLLRAINQLSSKEKVLFYRKYYYLQSTAQIAAELGMTKRAVEGKLYRLKIRLRRMLGGDQYA